MPLRKPTGLQWCVGLFARRSAYPRRRKRLGLLRRRLLPPRFQLHASRRGSGCGIERLKLGASTRDSTALRLSAARRLVAVYAGGVMSDRGFARTAGALILSSVVTTCGGGSPPGSTPPPKVYCTELDSTTHSCFCGTEVKSTDPQRVSSCDTLTVVGVSGCCAYLNATKDCACDSYICGYAGTVGMSTCACYWGNSGVTPENVCTSTHCCQSPQQPPPSATFCSCYTTPCQSGDTEVTSCPQSSPAFVCPVGEVPVSDCLNY